MHFPSLPDDIRSRIFEISKRAAARDQLEHCLKRRPKFLCYRSGGWYKFMKVTMQVHRNKTMEIDYCLHPSGLGCAGVNILEENKVKVYLQVDEDQLTCRVCTVHMTRHIADKSPSHDCWFESNAFRHKNMEIL